MRAHPADATHVSHAILRETEPQARRLGLPIGADTIRSWCSPQTFWLPRLAGGRDTTWTRGRAGWSSAT